MLRRIGPLALDITSVTGQRKAPQHKRTEARNAAELAAQNDPAARRLAAYMTAGGGI